MQYSTNCHNLTYMHAVRKSYTHLLHVSKCMCIIQDCAYLLLVYTLGLDDNGETVIIILLWSHDIHTVKIFSTVNLILSSILYGGKLWKVLTWVNLAKNHQITNFSITNILTNVKHL